MSIRNTTIAASLLILPGSPAMADSFLIHVHTGPDNPTKTVLGFLVALTAMSEGHDATLFLAGEELITDDALSSVEGVGTGRLQDHFDALMQDEARIYVSGKSAEARGITEADLEGKSAEVAMPARLVQLAADADVVLAY